MKPSSRFMKPQIVFGALLFIALLNLAEGMRCRPLNPERKEVLEAVLERPLRGCRLSRRQAMRAISRVHWLKRPEDDVSLNFRDQREMIRSELNRAELSRRERRMVLGGFRMAGISLNRGGRLNVSTECVMEVEPDVVTVLLADSRSPRVFNRMLARECRSRGLNVDSTVRNLPQTVNVVLFVRCVMWTVISFFVPFAGQVAVAIMKTVTTAVVTFVPCPSTAARMIYDSGMSSL